jgi:hypothetical protein
MTNELHEAMDLFRTGHTVYLSQPPYLSQARVTVRIPCGQTLAFSLGRKVGDVIPTVREILSDLDTGRRQINRLKRKAA